jgi:hypothetical protein
MSSGSFQLPIYVQYLGIPGGLKSDSLEIRVRRDEKVELMQKANTMMATGT